MKARRLRVWSVFLVILLVSLLAYSFGAMAGQGKLVGKIDLSAEKPIVDVFGPVSVVDEGVAQVPWVVLKLDKCGCYRIVVDTKDVWGYWLDLGNSPTNNGMGGDSGTFSHDSELTMYNKDLSISGNDIDYGKCPNESHPYVKIHNFADANTYILQAHDGYVRIQEQGGNGNIVTMPSCKPTEPCVFACGRQRKDKENNKYNPYGVNDSAYWLGLNHVVDPASSRTGGLVVGAEIYYYEGYQCCCGCDP